MTARTIWVIERGSYSDYRVLGVFSTKANAERVLAMIEPDDDPPSITEWPLDPAVTELGCGAIPNGTGSWRVMVRWNG